MYRIFVCLDHNAFIFTHQSTDKVQHTVQDLTATHQSCNCTANRNEHTVDGWCCCTHLCGEVFVDFLQVSTLIFKLSFWELQVLEVSKSAKVPEDITCCFKASILSVMHQSLSKRWKQYDFLLEFMKQYSSFIRVDTWAEGRSSISVRGHIPLPGRALYWLGVFMYVIGRLKSVLFIQGKLLCARSEHLDVKMQKWTIKSN